MQRNPNVSSQMLSVAFNISPLGDLKVSILNTCRRFTMLTKLKSVTKKIASSRACKVATRVGILLAPQLVLMAIGIYDQAAHAQGLVGAPVDPRYGQSNEVGQMADYGYDTARDISRVVTALSTVPSSMAGMKIAFGQRDGGESAMNVAKGLGIGFGGPTAVHLMGTFAINNFGGLGGGL
jgi:hypothetical protein